MTASRIVVADGTFAITRRTMFRKLFWTPSEALVHQGYLYALADAQRMYGVDVHHGALLPTHEHLTVTPREPNLPAFLRHLHRESASSRRSACSSTATTRWRTSGTRGPRTSCGCSGRGRSSSGSWTST